VIIILIYYTSVHMLSEDTEWYHVDYVKKTPGGVYEGGRGAGVPGVVLSMYLHRHFYKNKK